MGESAKPSFAVRSIRLLLWGLVALAIAGAATFAWIHRGSTAAPKLAPSHFGGPFTLIDGDGRSFSSEKLASKPYAIYFGFTRCADECPITLARLVRLREQVGGPRAFNIVFVTVDPTFDGPKEVGQYATLFNSPIIGLTGSPEQIRQVTKQYGIYAAPNPHPTPGEEILHTDTVLLFDRNGQLAANISPGEPDPSTLEKLKHLVG